MAALLTGMCSYYSNNCSPFDITHTSYIGSMALFLYGSYSGNVSPSWVGHWGGSYEWIVAIKGLVRVCLEIERGRY